MTPSRPNFRQKLGCWLHERWRLEAALRMPRLARSLDLGWLDLRNRHESLKRDPVSGGRICLWSDSSPLTVASVFPETASRLLHHCLHDWPLDLQPRKRTEADRLPDVSIIVGVRGTGRMAQFQTCLASLLAQTGAGVEVVVVEQSWRPEFAALIPDGVRYVHQQCTDPGMPYNRSWALNGGARLAAGRILVLHDADMLLPQGAAREIVRLMDQGLDGLRLPRLLFYLDADSSAQVQSTGEVPRRAGMERVVANNRTPVAVSRQAYFDVGGHDEAFYGWGAEDDEFMARLRTRNVSEGAMLPIIHLWHPSAAAGPSRERNAALLAQSFRRSVAERIAILSDRSLGGDVPSVPWPAAPVTSVDA